MPTGSSVVADLTTRPQINHQLKTALWRRIWKKNYSHRDAFLCFCAWRPISRGFCRLANAFADEAVSLDRIIKNAASKARQRSCSLLHVGGEKL